MRCLLGLLLVSVAVGCSSQGPSSSDASTEAGEAGTGAKANGTLGLWQTLAPMPSARANFCATVAGGFVVAVGGNYPDDGGFTKLDAVHVARFHDDGSLDPWQLAGHAPSPVTECTVAASGSTIYLLDGLYDDTSKEGILFTADLAGDGTLGAWTQGPALPNQDRLLDDLAFTTSGRLFSLTSKLSGSCASVSTSLSNLSLWRDIDFFPEFRGRPQWAEAVAGGSLFGYVLGGYSDADAGNQVLASGEGVALNASDGTTGATFDVTPLPQATTFGTAVGVDDWVFVLGGRDAIFGGTPRNAIVSARADAQGKLGAWTAQAPLPAPRSNVAAVVAGDYLYVLGGAAAQATDTVYAAQVRF
jgi:serine/threonine-protein kinase PknK